MLGPARGVLHEEPSAVILHAGVCEGRGPRGYGAPTRARSWKRRTQPRRCLRSRLVFSYSEPPRPPRPQREIPKNSRRSLRASLLVLPLIGNTEGLHHFWRNSPATIQTAAYRPPADCGGQNLHEIHTSALLVGGLCGRLRAHQAAARLRASRGRRRPCVHCASRPRSIWTTGQRGVGVDHRRPARRDEQRRLRVPRAGRERGSRVVDRKGRVRALSGLVHRRCPGLRHAGHAGSTAAAGGGNCRSSCQTGTSFACRPARAFRRSKPATSPCTRGSWTAEILNQSCGNEPAPGSTCSESGRVCNSRSSGSAA